MRGLGPHGESALGSSWGGCQPSAHSAASGRVGNSLPRQVWCLARPPAPSATTAPRKLPDGRELRKTNGCQPSAHIKRDGVCSGRVGIKDGRGSRETSRLQTSVLTDTEEGKALSAVPGTLDSRGLWTHPEEPQAAPDTLARDMLDVIIFIHFLFSKINIQYIVYLYIY